MKVFVAGASGTIGARWCDSSWGRGGRHWDDEPGGRTRPRSRPRAPRPVVCDALDADAVKATVVQDAPEVVISQLTRLPKDYDPRSVDYGPTNRARYEGGRNMIAAAREAGARRFVSQSVAFIYAPEGELVKDEQGKPWTDAPEPFRDGAKSTLEHEREVLEAPGLDGLVLRYGQFYGPATYYASDGGIARAGASTPLSGRRPRWGMFSFIHVEDAASATLAAVNHGASGIYNVVDDEPAPERVWLPAYAEAVGAKPPRRFPTWLARIFAGKFAVIMATELRGASNAKAKRELGWTPRYPSWREGFREALG